MKAIFAPRSIALIGISDDPAKSSSRPLRYLRRHGFTGAVHAVNPKRTTVQGEPSLPDLDAIPGPVDHAYVLVGTTGVADALAACARKQVSVATILPGGFAETGAEGAARQTALVDAARASGLRLIGPNSLGVLNLPARMTLTGNAALDMPALLPGRLAVLSQSGSLIGTLLSRGFARRIGFSKLVSLGNEADLSVGEIGCGLVDDPETDAFLLFLETLRDPDRIARFAEAAHAAGKPIIAYKLGRSDAGQEAAVSHTGAMIGSDAAVSAFFRDTGILRVDHLETLFELPALVIGRAPLPPGPKSVGIVATTGGGGAMVIDRLGMAGIETVPPQAPTLAALRARGVEIQPGRLVDLTLAGTRYEIMHATVDTMRAAPEFQLVTAVVGSSAQFRPELAVRPLIDAERRATPLAVFLVPQADEALGRLAEAGIAAFRTPETCADGIAAFFNWRAPRPRRGVDFDMSAAGAALAASAGTVLDECQSQVLFSALGIPVAASVVLGVDGPFPEIEQPVALKILSADIPHKTDAGGIELGIGSRDALVAAAAAIRQRVATRLPGVTVERLLMQRMECGVAEVLLGYRVDPQVGPIVSVALGGTLTEIYHDFALALAPVDLATARRLIDEVRGFALLRGYRGRPPGDIEALADAVSRFSRLAALENLAEAEINPLIVKPAGQGVVAVDGLARRVT